MKELIFLNFVKLVTQFSSQCLITGHRYSGNAETNAIFRVKEQLLLCLCPLFTVLYCIFTKHYIVYRKK